MRSHRLSPFYTTPLTAGLVDIAPQVKICTDMTTDSTPLTDQLLLYRSITSTPKAAQKETVPVV